jgi:hypothetical protein
MTRLAVLALMTLIVLACGSTPSATPTPIPTSPPTSTPIPTPPDDLPKLTLPGTISGIPGPDDDFTATLEPHTPADSVAVGEDQVFTLGHCGLGSPIDIDGGMWDPIAGDDGLGGPLTEDQVGDLINATPVVLVLVDHDTMLMATQHGARILLTRHDGPRAYFLCA